MEPLPPLEVITRENAHKVKLLTVLGFGYFTGLAWSPDEKIVAVATSKGIWLHEADDLKKTPQQLQTTIRKVNGVAFSPDNRLLASAESDGVVRVWAMDTRTLRMELHGHDGEVMSVKFSPDGMRLFSGGSDSTVSVWDLATGAQIAVLKCQTVLPLHSSPFEIFASRSISFLVISPDGNTLVACGKHTSNIFLFDTTTYVSKADLTPQLRGIKAVGFTDNGAILVVETSFDQFWDCDFWDMQTFELQDRISCVFAYEPESQKGIWQAEGEIGFNHYFVNTTTEVTLTQANFETRNVVFNGSKTKSICCDYSSPVELWQGIPFIGQRLGSSAVAYSSDAGEVLFSPDSSKAIIFGSWWSVPTLEPLGGIRVFQESVGPETQENVRQPARVSNRRNQLIDVWVGDNGNIYLWDNLNDNRLLELRGHGKQLGHNMPVAFSSDGKQLASGGIDGTVRLWEIQTGKHEIIWRQEGQTVRSVDLSSDGRFVAFVEDSTSIDHVLNTVRVIDLRTRREVFSAKPAHKVTFSLDSAVLFVTSRQSNDDITQLWDFESKRQFGHLPGLSPYVFEPSFTQDGEVTLIAQKDEFQIWDWRNQTQLTSIDKLTDSAYFTSAACSSDGKLIALSVISESGAEIHLLGIPAN
jgi:WD40 repeat protein